MPRSITTACFVAIALSIAVPAHAQRLHKGNSLVLVGISGHSGEFEFEGFRFETGEVGGHLACAHFLSDHWTVDLSGGYHFSRVKEEQNNPPETSTLDTHSFTGRIGGDRFAFIDDDVALYAGPGAFVTVGRAKSDFVMSPPVPGLRSQGPNTTEVGFNGRIGMYARLRKGAALFGHIGQNLSHSSGKDSAGKVTWWTSTHEGSVGLAFDF